VIPAFEESSVIGGLVRDLKALAPVLEVIVVDDGSQDQTAETARQAGARVISHPYNMGNGAAVKTGIRNARGEFVLLMDGDGQHRPDEVERLFAFSDQFEMVVGSRAARDQASVWRFCANAVYNRIASYVTQVAVADLTSGFRVIRRKVALRYLYLLPNTFSYPTTLTLAMLRSGHSVRYVPVPVNKRTGQSKIRIVRDGARFLFILMKITMLFSPLRIFFPVSLFFAGAALANYGYTFVKYHRFTNMSALLAMTSVLIFMLGLVAEQVAQLRMDRTEPIGEQSA